MGRASILEHMAEPLQAKLRQKLRAGESLLDIQAWLQSEGVETSKSALGRYTLTIKARTRVAAELGRHLSEDRSAGRPHQDEAIDLLLELGAMQVRQAAILGRLNELGFVPK